MRGSGRRTVLHGGSQLGGEGASRSEAAVRGGTSSSRAVEREEALARLRRDGGGGLGEGGELLGASKLENLARI